MLNQLKISALTNWLIAGAPPQDNFADTIAELGRRMNAAGLPVGMLAVYVLNINPTVLGSQYWWTPRGGANVNHVPQEVMATPEWQGTIAQTSMTSRHVIQHRMGCGNDLDRHASTTALAARGYVDYLACPLPAMHGPVSVFAVATKQSQGFSEEEVVAIKRLQAPLARVVEAQSLHANTISILSTYVGRNAGERVLHGQIRRGDLENISAVILFADLQDFTHLSNTRAPAEVLATLNHLFDTLDVAIRNNGGEVLKFLGDGLLAIFATHDDMTAQAAAAVGALSALEEARAALGEPSEIGFRAALHVGDIHYGNIGSASRLDFTVVGPAVNLTSRMLQAASEHDVATVCSSSFANLLDGQARLIAEIALKGFSQPVSIFTL